MNTVINTIALQHSIEASKHRQVIEGLRAVRARRLMIFVDAMNVLEGTKDLAENLCDINPSQSDCIAFYPEAMQRSLTDYPTFRCIRTYWHDAAVPRDHPMYSVQKPLHEQLRVQPYTEVVLGTHSGQGRDRRQKGVDIALAVNMLQHAFRDNYDCAALVSGDADFAPVVKEVKSTGKQVICCSFTWKLSKDREIVDASDDFVALEEILPGAIAHIRADIALGLKAQEFED